MRILVVGLWHLGCVTATCLAKRHSVVGFDPDPKVVDGLMAGKPPIYEPGLCEAIGSAQKRGALTFTADLPSAAREADAVCITFDTPVDENDEVDVSPVEKSVASLAPHLRGGQLVLVSSQVPIGTCRKLQASLDSAGAKAQICYTPENLQLGTAIDAFMKPNRIVFGVQGEAERAKLEGMFEGIPCERLPMDLESAEMVKHALNSYFALMISYSGEISNLCEKTGANAILVMDALRKERKVSPFAPLMPGLGFGGGTLARDLQVLRKVGKERGIGTPILDSAYNSNRERMGYVKAKLASALGSLEGKNVAFFGLTYKPNTDTLRRSLSLDVIAQLSEAGVKVRAYDPAIKGQIASRKDVLVCQSPLEAAEGADALVIMTAWDEFKSLDYQTICGKMRQKVIIDARNALDSNKLGAGIMYYGVGVTHA